MSFKVKQYPNMSMGSNGSFTADEIKRGLALVFALREREGFQKRDFDALLDFEWNMLVKEVIDENSLNS